MQFAFICQFQGYRTMLQTSLLPHIKIFWKVKRGLEIVSLPYFLHDFWRKIFLLLHSINWSNFIFWLLLLHEILGSMCMVIACQPGCEAIDFEINIFLIKPFFNMTRSHDKSINILSTKRVFKMKQKAFFIMFEGLSLKQYIIWKVRV